MTAYRVGDEVEFTRSSGRWARGVIEQKRDDANDPSRDLYLLRARDDGLSYWRGPERLRPWGQVVAAAPPAPTDPTEAAIKAAIDEMKEHIGDQAMTLAKEHGWCTETEEALLEMGIDPKVQLGGEVTVRFRVSAELMSRIGGEPLLVSNPARYLKDNIVPRLEGATGRLTPRDVSILDVQVNRVTKTRRSAE